MAIEEQKLALQREAPNLPRMDALIEPIMGPLPTAPDDRKPWHYLCTALQNYYAMSDGELVGVLRRVTFRRTGWYDDGEDYWVN